jgi:hypothetical protein
MPSSTTSPSAPSLHVLSSAAMTQRAARAVSSARDVARISELTSEGRTAGVGEMRADTGLSRGRPWGVVAQVLVMVTTRSRHGHTVGSACNRREGADRCRADG